MFKFYFRAKAYFTHGDIKDALREIDHIVSPYVKLDAPISDCTIVEMFDTRMPYVAYPPHALPHVEVTSYTKGYDDFFHGRLRLPNSYQDRHFSISKGVLYIGKAKDDDGNLPW